MFFFKSQLSRFDSSLRSQFTFSSKWSEKHQRFWVYNALYNGRNSSFVTYKYHIVSHVNYFILNQKNYFKWGSKLSLSLSKVLISDNQSRPLREIEKWRCFLPLNLKFELTRDFLSADVGFRLYEMLETFYYHFSILH